MKKRHYLKTWNIILGVLIIICGINFLIPFFLGLPPRWDFIILSILLIATGVYITIKKPLTDNWERSLIKKIKK